MFTNLKPVAKYVENHIFGMFLFFWYYFIIIIIIFFLF